jgi:hypothetical protein
VPLAATSGATVDLVVHLAWGGPAATYSAWTKWDGQTSQAPLIVDVEGALAALRRGSIGESRGLLRSARPPPSADEASTVGAALFQALFAGALAEPYALSRKAADDAKVPWRLVLVVEAAPLGRVPWELLFDARYGRYLAWSSSVLRSPAQGGRTVAPPRAEKLRIAWVAASPRGFGALDLARERQVLESALLMVPEAARPELVAVTPPTLQALASLLLNRSSAPGLQAPPIHVLHIACHGDLVDQEGRILLSTPEGEPQPVSATQLATAIMDHPSLRLVILNACNGAAATSHDALSSVAALLAARGVPAVIAMQTPILDGFAVDLTGQVYAGLVRGERVDVALATARHLLAVQRPEWLEQGAWASPMLWLCGEGAEVVSGPWPATDPAPAEVEVEVSKLAAQPSLVYLAAPEDEALRRALARALFPTLKRAGVTEWHADDQAAGGDADTALDEAIKSARVVLLLISNDYLADPLCQRGQAAALARMPQGLRVIPVHVRAASWRNEPFAGLTPTPRVDRGALPVVQQPDRDSAWASVAEAVRQVVDLVMVRPRS